MIDLDPSLPWNLPDRLRRRSRAVGSRGHKHLRTAVVLARLLAAACEAAADDIEGGGPMADHLPDPDHTARLLRSLSTQAELACDLIEGDMP